jgi:hypothetical protein
MVEGLTYIKPCAQIVASRSVKNYQRGMEQWQLVGLITRRSEVRILLPLPNNQAARVGLEAGPRPKP